MLQALKTDFLQEKGEARYRRVLEVPGTRGRILDRHGEALAVSTPVKSVWAIPEDVEGLAGAAQAARPRCSTLSPRELEQQAHRATRESSSTSSARSRPRSPERVAELGIAGLYQQREYRRYYPGGEITAHVVGFTGVDDTGQEGIELAFQASLAGTPGSRRVIKDRLGHVVEDVESIRAAQDGKDLQLAIDGKIQSLAFAALKAGRRGAQGEGRRAGGARRAHRRSAGARQRADLQPEQPQQR